MINISQPAITFSKLTIETLEYHWRRSGIFNLNIKHILHLAVSFVNLEQVNTGWEFWLICFIQLFRDS